MQIRAGTRKLGRMILDLLDISKADEGQLAPKQSAVNLRSLVEAVTTDLAIDAAIAGTGVIYLFEDWLRPQLDAGKLEPVLEPWWQSFSGPFLYYPGRRLVPAPLRAFIDFIKVSAEQA